jgi:hypothetical protein
MINAVPNCCWNLANAVSDLTSASHVEFNHLRDWCSATFCGYQMEFTLVLAGEDTMKRAQDLQTKLPDHDFPSGRYFVADCLVSRIIPMEDSQIKVRIETLLIES